MLDLQIIWPLICMNRLATLFPRPHAIWLAAVLVGAVLPAAAWPGMALGCLGLAILWKTRYQGSFLWFAVFPGLYAFWGIELELESLKASFTLWGQIWAALLLWGLVASAMQQNQRWACLLLGLAWFAHPSATLLAFWIATQGVYTLEAGLARAHQAGRRLQLSGRSTWGWLLAWGSMALLASLVPLPQPATPAGPPPAQAAPTRPGEPAALSPASPNTDSRQPTTITVREASQTSFTSWATAALAILQPFSGLLLLGVALILLAVAWRTPGRRGQTQWRGWLPLVVVSLTCLMLAGWFVVYQNRPPGNITSMPAVPPPLITETPGPPPQIERLTSNYDWALGLNLLFMLLWIAGSLVLLYGVWRLWKWRESTLESVAAIPAHRDWKSSPPPADTLRRLYAWWTNQMQSRGLGRHPWESPREYAQRLARAWPAVQPFLEYLTLRYQQVRYGGQADTSADPSSTQATEQILEQTRSPKP